MLLFFSRPSAVCKAYAEMGWAAVAAQPITTHKEDEPSAGGEET